MTAQYVHFVGVRPVTDFWGGGGEGGLHYGGRGERGNAESLAQCRTHTCRSECPCPGDWAVEDCDGAAVSPGVGGAADVPG